MAKHDELPQYSPVDQYASLHKRRRRRKFITRIVALTCLGCLALSAWPQKERHHGLSMLSIERLEADYRTCSNLRKTPHDPSGHRERSARYVEGNKAVLIRNATVWTGEPKAGTSPEAARNGTGYEWIRSDVLLQYGLIKRVQPHISDKDLPSDYDVFDARGRPVTAGIIDMHSHTGVDTLPELAGGTDVNEVSNDITPYVRSLDGFNPLDPQIQVIKSGGVTTSLILPGSGNNMGGEAYVIKHSVGRADGRAELSVEDMLADPDRNWRYMKMACGENAKSVYGTFGRDFGPFSRLGEAWYFRHAFEQASKFKASQDEWCQAADRIGAQNMRTYLPADLKWESLSAVLRGQVHVNTHCYTVTDLESFVGFTNEFKFPVRAFHHAHQTFLIPEVLKRAYGKRTPAAALFADNMNYKVESYTASEQAGRILHEAGITPVYVSDNPVLNAQHVVFEAAKAYRYGLPYHVALAGVTSASAELLGLGERIGKIKPGFDADIAVWDSDPLSVGAAPVQVFIDGTPQFTDPFELEKPLSAPLSASETIRRPEGTMQDLRHAVISGISKILLPGTEQTFSPHNSANLVIANGSIVCIGTCAPEIAAAGSAPTLALQDGHVVPPATIFGSLLGLEEIQAEDATNDGGNSGSTFSAAIDGLALEGKNLASAYARGVTRAVSAPSFRDGGLKGVSVGFRTHARHALEPRAVFAPHAAVHYTLTPAVKDSSRTPSISAAVAELRKKLYTAAAHFLAAGADDDDRELDDETHFLVLVVAGELPLVITAHSADTIAAVLRLKAEIDEHVSSSSLSPSSPSPPPSASQLPAASASSTTARRPLQLILHGGAEAHLLARELAAANASVVLAPLQPYAATWDQRRGLSGAPLTNGSGLDALHAARVRVAIGVAEDWEARDLWLYAGVARANGGGRVSEADAVAFVSGNVHAMLGLDGQHHQQQQQQQQQRDVEQARRRRERLVGGEGEEQQRGVRAGVADEFVVFDGSPFDIRGQVRAVADGSGKVSVWME